MARSSAARSGQLPPRGRDRRFDPYRIDSIWMDREPVLLRLAAAVAAIAALLASVSLAQAQPDERQEMLRGGAQKKCIYNILGFDGTDFSRTTVRYETKYGPGTIVVWEEDSGVWATSDAFTKTPWPAVDQYGSSGSRGRRRNS